jgi:hypothetical protein
VAADLELSFGDVLGAFDVIDTAEVDILFEEDAVPDSPRCVVLAVDIEERDVERLKFLFEVVRCVTVLRKESGSSHSHL